METFKDIIATLVIFILALMVAGSFFVILYNLYHWVQ
jgi:hypothetical protein